jgi:phosphoribosylglycinamide formyltransferase-1
MKPTTALKRTTSIIKMVSEPVFVEFPEPLERLTKDKEKFLEIVNEHQERLKAVGDWKIFPLSIEMISRGRFALDEKNRVYVDGEPVPDGYKEKTDE